MKVNNSCQRKAGVTNQRSYFDWGSNMQVIRKGNGEIAMTGSELVRFFGVTWRKLNHRLQTIVKSSNLHPDERGADEEPVFISGGSVISTVSRLYFFIFHLVWQTRFLIVLARRGTFLPWQSYMISKRSPNFIANCCDIRTQLASGMVHFSRMFRYAR